VTLAQRIHVMVVDDSWVSRALVTDALEQLGIRNVSIARSGREALDSLMFKPIHLVISDMKMPDLSGLELLKSLREYIPTAAIRFILVTGSEDPTLAAQGRLLGLGCLVKKPFSVSALKNAIEQVIGKLS
jgi:two-component system, chemotaxis family, chemotaxis protein CheY